MTADGDLCRLRRNGLSLYLNMSGGDGVCAVFLSAYNESIGNRRRTAGVTVHHRVARLCGSVGPRDKLKPIGEVADAEV